MESGWNPEPASWETRRRGSAGKRFQHFSSVEEEGVVEISRGGKVGDLL